MSVVVVDERIFDRVAFKMFLAAQKSVTPDCSFPCCRGLTVAQIDVMVNHWYGLNMITYCIAYGDELVTNWRSMKRYTSKDPISTVVFVKWLRCIRDNINAKIIDQKILPLAENLQESILFLDQLLVEAMKAAISCLPEYKRTPWGDLPEEKELPAKVVREYRVQFDGDFTPLIGHGAFCLS